MVSVELLPLPFIVIAITVYYQSHCYYRYYQNSEAVTLSLELPLFIIIDD